MNAPIPENYEPPMTLPEAAGMLRKSVKTVRRLITQGHLPSFKIGGRRQVHGSEVQKYIQRQIVKGTGVCHA
jgi:excisionase family DNA binding protein